jgi:hypothetical protein
MKARKKPVSKRLTKKSGASKKNCRKAGSLTKKGSSVGGKVLRKCRTKKSKKK